ALSKSSLARSWPWNNSCPIPTNCAPCPGKIYAFILVVLLLKSGSKIGIIWFLMVRYVHKWAQAQGNLFLEPAGIGHIIVGDPVDLPTAEFRTDVLDFLGRHASIDAIGLHMGPFGEHRPGSDDRI